MVIKVYSTCFYYIEGTYSAEMFPIGLISAWNIKYYKCMNFTLIQIKTHYALWIDFFCLPLVIFIYRPETIDPLAETYRATQAEGKSDLRGD